MNFFRERFRGFVASKSAFSRHFFTDDTTIRAYKSCGVRTGSCRLNDEGRALIKKGATSFRCAVTSRLIFLASAQFLYLGLR